MEPDQIPRYANSRYARTKLGHDPNDVEGRDSSLASMFVVGDRVLVDGKLAASIAYFGELDFASGDWLGVVLDEPRGNHDGKVHGREYFHCAPHHGLFVRPARVTRAHQQQRPLATSDISQDSALGSRASSRAATPSRADASPRGAAQSGRSSTAESYYYDEDYRSPSKPSIESLRRKLKSMQVADTNDTNDSDQQRQQQPIINGILKRAGSYRTSRERSLESRPASNYCHYDSECNPEPESVFHFRPARVRSMTQVHEPQPAASLSASSTPTSDLANESQSARYDIHNLDDRPQLRCGDRLVVNSERGPLLGSLRFLGETNFATGEWAGVELDEPAGKNDGTVLGHRYFRCQPHRGLFVPVARVHLLHEQSAPQSRGDFASCIKSTIRSPPPRLNPTIRNSPQSPGGSSLADQRSHTPTTDRGHSSTSGLSSSSLGWQANNNDNDRFTRYHPSSSLPSSRPPSSLLTDYDHCNYYANNNKFLESDLDKSLRQYMQKPKASQTNRLLNYNNNNNDHHNNDNHHHCQSQPIPSSVKYTFKSSKYDGNPIAMRTVEYNN